jgi:hypothetical protein
MLELPGGEAPLGLKVTIKNGNPLLCLVNGSERTRVPNVPIAGNNAP